MDILGLHGAGPAVLYGSGASSQNNWVKRWQENGCPSGTSGCSWEFGFAQRTQRAGKFLEERKCMFMVQESGGGGGETA